MFKPNSTKRSFCLTEKGYAKPTAYREHVRVQSRDLFSNQTTVRPPQLRLAVDLHGQHTCCDPIAPFERKRTIEWRGRSRVEYIG